MRRPDLTDPEIARRMSVVADELMAIYERGPEWLRDHEAMRGAMWSVDEIAHEAGERAARVADGPGGG